MARETPHIYAALEDQQETYQEAVFKVEGKNADKYISILVYPRSTHSYVTPRITKSCGLKRKKHANFQLVQLAIGIKRKVSEVVEECPIEINGFFTTIYINIFSLGSYNTLIGVNQLEKRRAKVDYYAKIVECHNEEGNQVEVKGVPQLVLVRQISTLQLRKYFKKGCQVYVVHMEDLMKDKDPKLEDYELLQEYENVFLEEVSGFPPKRDIDFTINIMIGVAMVSKFPDRMSTPELMEFKLQLQELMNQKYIRPSVSP